MGQTPTDIPQLPTCPPPEQGYQRAIRSFVVFGLLIISWLALSAVYPTTFATLPFWKLLLFSACSWPLIVVFHELGHLLAGRAVGMRLNLLALGPIQFEKHSGAWHVGRNRVTPSTGGAVRMFPLPTGESRAGTIIMALGGVGMNAITLLASLSLLTTAWVQSHELMADIMSCFSFVSLYCTIKNLYPFVEAGSETDGEVVVTLLRGGPLAERKLAFFRLGIFLASNVRPRDWPPSIAQRVVRPADGSSVECRGCQIALMHAIDTGDLSSARTLCARMIWLSPTLGMQPRAAIHMTAISFLVLDGQPALAQQLMPELTAHADYIPQYCRTIYKALEAYFRGDHAQAVRFAQEPIQLPYAGDNEQYSKLLAHIVAHPFTAADTPSS